MIGCPVASIRRTGSLEVHIEDWCVGCGLCANSCPFGNINMIDLATPSGAPLPDGPIDLSSGKLKATICDLCAGYDGPNCVYACPHDAAIRVNPTAFLATADLQVP
jgi:Fe-S-cluster-containing hydrogenase component 2